MKNIKFVLLFMIVFSSYSQVESLVKEEIILEKIKKLKTDSSLDYVEIIPKYRSEIMEYLDKKREVCLGNYSTKILGSQESIDDQKEQRVPKAKSKECLSQLNIIHLKFLDALYYSKKRYLKKLYESRLKKLEKDYYVQVKKKN